MKLVEHPLLVLLVVFVCKYYMYHQIAIEIEKLRLSGKKGARNRGDI